MSIKSSQTLVEEAQKKIQTLNPSEAKHLVEKKEITYNKFSYLFNSNILENGSYFNHHNFLELDI